DPARREAARRLRLLLLAEGGERLPVDASVSARRGEEPTVLVVISPVLRRAGDGSPLIPRLVEGAGQVRWQSSERGVFEVACQALDRAGLWAGLFTLEGDELVFSYLAVPGWTRSALER